MRERVRAGQLTIPKHAFQAMLDDALWPSDLKHCVLHGTITERQWDEKWGEWKYVIEGEARDGRVIEMVAKLGPDDTVVITVYLSFQF
ncbi:MAG: DUF4258 domain-containing protein [Acidobacteria bacterium]|nr:DUF4258 domain-containing protein [Acidobacteriota bacterium]MBI3421676.1 DUF4258 domain-containing protein [Acidobacteriota bacterium]